MKYLHVNCRSVAVEYRSLIAAMVSFSTMLMQSAWAALPTAADVTAGAGVTNTTSPLGFIREMTTTTGGIMAIILSALVTIGVGYQMYASFVKGREKGEWRDFATTSMIGMSLVVVVILFAIFGTDIVA